MGGSCQSSCEPNESLNKSEKSGRESAEAGEEQNKGLDLILCDFSMLRLLSLSWFPILSVVGNDDGSWVFELSV